MNKAGRTQLYLQRAMHSCKAASLNLGLPSDVYRPIPLGYVTAVNCQLPSAWGGTISQSMAESIDIAYSVAGDKLLQSSTSWKTNSREYQGPPLEGVIARKFNLVTCRHTNYKITSTSLKCNSRPILMWNTVELHWWWWVSVSRMTTWGCPEICLRHGLIANIQTAKATYGPVTGPNVILIWTLPVINCFCFRTYLKVIIFLTPASASACIDDEQCTKDGTKMDLYMVSKRALQLRKLI
jgi:hypothetical protein